MNGIRVVAALLGTALLAACGGSASPSSDGSSSAEVVWKNGVSGPFFGDTPGVAGGAGASVAVVAATDPISGDSQAVQVSNGTSPFGMVTFQTISAHDASAYASGHVQFDLRMDTSTASTVTLYWGVQYQGSQTFNHVNLNAAAFPVGSFVHVSEPVSAFSQGSSQDLRYLIVPLAVYVAGGTGPLFTIDNVRWTAD